MIKRISLSALLLSGAGLVMAENVAPTDTTETTMQAMQIRAVAVDKPAVPANVPSTTESVTAKQISESINAVTTPQILQYLPSVHVRERYIGDTNSVLVMRVNSSIASAQTTVYADDLLLSNFLNNSFSTAPRWNMVSPEEIDRVDVMYGPFSALYPGNSAGGVVVIKTRMPEKFEAHVKLDYFGENFKLYGSDKYYEGVHGAASIGSRVGDFSFWVSADHLDNHGHPMTFTTATLKSTAPVGKFTIVNNGAYSDIDTSGKSRIITASAGIDHTVQDNLKIKLGYDFSPTIRGAYTLGYWQNDSEKRGESYLKDAAGNTIYGSGGSGAYSFLRINGKDYTVVSPASSNAESEHIMHGLSLKSDTSGTWDWDVVASYFNQNKDLTRASTGNFGLMASDGAAMVGGTLTDASGTGWGTFDVRGIWRPEGGLRSKHQISFGYHFDRYALDSVTYGSNTAPLPNWRTSTAGAVGTNSYGKTETQALYLQDAWAFAPDWKLVLGGRLESWSAYDGSNYNAANAAGFKQLNYQDRSNTAFSPKASLSFQVSDDWSLRGSLGKAYRFPTVAEMFQTFSDASGAKVNDPNLKPEHVVSGELVAERWLNNGAWRTSFFWENKSDALISQTDITNPAFTISSIQNVDKVYTNGVETSLQLKDLWMSGLDLNASVTYVDSTITKDSKNPGLEGTDQPRIPDWRATLMGVYHANDKLTFTLAGRYSGRQHNALYDTVNKKYNDVNPNVYGAVSHYFVMDAKVVYKFADRWSANLGVNNLNNFKYYVNPNPYPQRTWFAGMKFDY